MFSCRTLLGQGSAPTILKARFGAEQQKLEKKIGTGSKARRVCSVVSLTKTQKRARDLKKGHEENICNSENLKVVYLHLDKCIFSNRNGCCLEWRRVLLISLLKFPPAVYLLLPNLGFCSMKLGRKRVHPTPGSSYTASRSIRGIQKSQNNKM